MAEAGGDHGELVESGDGVSEGGREKRGSNGRTERRDRNSGWRKEEERREEGGREKRGGREGREKGRRGREEGGRKGGRGSTRCGRSAGYSSSLPSLSPNARFINILLRVRWRREGEREAM